RPRTQSVSGERGDAAAPQAFPWREACLYPDSRLHRAKQERRRELANQAPKAMDCPRNLASGCLLRKSNTKEGSPRCVEVFFRKAFLKERSALKRETLSFFETPCVPGRRRVTRVDHSFRIWRFGRLMWRPKDF